MEVFDKELQELIAKGKAQGYLTYDEVIHYLPDEAVDPEKLDNLLIALDELGIGLVNEAPEEEFSSPSLDATASLAEEGELADEAGEVPLPISSDVQLLPPEEPAKWSNDPIRLYLAQMAEIPLLTREQEIALAKKIEVTRKRFRRTVLGCAMAMRNTISTLNKVHGGALPFDRTVKMSLTEGLSKEQILARMPH
ncbi:MAG TPA: RNA polymerase subunit sigma-70, partial [Planctomycetaceae bacterium]|nr:RNA polymerase subunit sigma-70 [Planctomycetaceae bacterium]